MDMTSTYHLNIFKSSNDFVTDPLILILNCFQPGHGGDPAWRGNPVWFAQENLSCNPQAPQGPGCHAYPLHAGAHYNLNVEYPMIPQEWFLCIFARTLPWPSVLRVCFFLSIWWWSWWWWQCWWFTQVWDMFCCEGVKVLFRVALVLIKHALPRKASSS